MYGNRHGEQGGVPERRERFYQVGHDWYFTIRKGLDQGPYESEIEARLALREFIQSQLLVECG